MLIPGTGVTTKIRLLGQYEFPRILQNFHELGTITFN